MGAHSRHQHQATISYDVNFNQAVDPASVQTSDLTLTGNVGGSVTNVQVMNGDTTAHFTVHFVNGGSVTASIGAGAITANGCNTNAAFSGNYTVEGFAPCSWAAGPNMPDLNVSVRWRVSSSRLTANFTPWADAVPITRAASSLTPLSMIQWQQLDDQISDLSRQSRQQHGVRRNEPGRNGLHLLRRRLGSCQPNGHGAGFPL